jgi:hypothetical protein
MSAVDAHFDNHGDSFPRTYWRDADGDGYGDPNGATDMCPNDGFVSNADDCDDAEPGTNPDGEESCGTDNNCDGVVEVCEPPPPPPPPASEPPPPPVPTVSCPCFTPEQIRTAYDAVDADTLVDVACEFDENITDVWWEASWEPVPEQPGDWELSVFASYETWLDDQPYCYRSWVKSSWNDVEGTSVWEFDQYNEYITIEQHEECQGILFDWANSQALYCVDRTIPPDEY